MDCLDGLNRLPLVQPTIKQVLPDPQAISRNLTGAKRYMTSNTKAKCETTYPGFWLFFSGASIDREAKGIWEEGMR